MLQRRAVGIEAEISSAVSRGLVPSDSSPNAWRVPMNAFAPGAPSLALPFVACLPQAGEGWEFHREFPPTP